jgi:molecular chaperone GrpE (heat shock protein)
MSTPQSAETAPEPPADDPPATVVEAVEPAAPEEPGPAEEPGLADEPGPVDESAQTEVVAALGRIEDRLAESQRLIDRQAEIAAKLHAENQVLRAGELRKAQEAMVLSVLRVFDDVSRMAAATEDPAGCADLVIVADTLADALARNGVEQLVVEVGEPFEARRHKVATIAPTADLAADRTVAYVVRPGFTWSDGEPVRVADVAVFKHTAPAETEPPAEQ